MTTTAEYQAEGRARSILPVVALLLTQIVLYVWMAPRGFEFTDESYYFLNYLYWREPIGSMTFFGAYFEWPFLMLGQSVPAIRIFSLILLLASSAFFTREGLGYVARREGLKINTPWAIVVAGMAASMFYFGYLSTLRAPSYNLLVLVSMLVATGLLLSILERGNLVTNARWKMVGYGLAIGACGLGKASSGLMLVLFHTLFFAMVNRDWHLKHVLEFFSYSFAGVSLNFAMLQWGHPRWLDALLAGVASGSSSGSYSLFSLVNHLRWEVQVMAPAFLLLTIVVLVIALLVFRRCNPLSSSVCSAIVVVLIGGCALGLIWGQKNWWLPMLGLSTLILWSLEVNSRMPFHLVRSDLTELALMTLLFAMPIAFSFGTNMRVMEHSQMAGVFPIVALLLRLYRLSRLGILASPPFYLCLAVLCVPTLVTQIRAATSINYTYRQLSALSDQSIPVQLGTDANTLLVDEITRKSLESVIDAAQAAGFEYGQTIMDLTGDGPGLIYALRGHPLGTTWLLGGYPGSQINAANLVDKLRDEAMRNAWLLSSDNNPRAIQGWQQLLDKRLGYGAHELVKTIFIHAPYRWVENAPESLSVQLWKPRGQQSAN